MKYFDTAGDFPHVSYLSPPCAHPAEDGRLHILETAVPAVIRPALETAVPAVISAQGGVDIPVCPTEHMFCVRPLMHG